MPFLCRNLQQCPTFVKTTCYKSMVRPIIEYAYNSHTALNIQKFESIQRRAARFSNCSVSSLLESLILPTLQSRRKKTK